MQIFTWPFPSFACMLSWVQLFATLWIVASFLFLSRQECRRGLPFPTPGGLPDPGIKPSSLESPALASRFFCHWATRELYTQCPFTVYKCILRLYTVKYTDIKYMVWWVLTIIYTQIVLCSVAQCVQLFVIPWDCSLPGSSVHGDSPGKNTGVGCHALLQRIFPTQWSNPGLPHCRWILYHLSH